MSVTDLREQNPLFSKLLDILENGKLEGGQLKNTADQLSQARSRLHSVKQHYLEQLVLSTELEGVLHTRTKHVPSVCMAAAQLQHCLGVCPDATLLGVEPEHLRAVDPMKGIQRSKKEVHLDLEQRLKSKCLRIVQWHTPLKETSSNDSLHLAKITQLPQVLRQQREEETRTKQEIEDKRREAFQKLITKHKVLVEMCNELKSALEKYKLGVTVEANRVALDYTQTQCQAMLGKLEVMYHQLLKGICSEGRLQALKEIKSHLESTRQKLEERLVQSQQIVKHYQSLGEAFTSLAEQYHEILTDIENKQWAIAELTKAS